MAAATLPPALLCLAAATGSPAVRAKSLHPDHRLLRGEVQAYGDWLVGCDTAASCTMIGFPQQQEGLDQQPVRIEIGPGGLSGEALVVRQTAGGAEARLPLKGFAAGLRAMLAHRERLLGQLADAAPARGTPPGGLPRPAPAKVRRLPAVPVMVSGIVPVATRNSCADSFATNVRHFRFPDGADLWSYECAAGAAAEKTFFAMSTGLGQQAVPLELPEPRRGMVAAGRDGLATAGVWFDWDFGVLRHYQFQPGRDDCGVLRVWTYTAQGWQLIERREMPVCRGLEPGDWIRTHVLELGGSAQDD